MTEQEAHDLLKRYKLNQCTDAERAFVNEWFSQHTEADYITNNEVIEQLGKDILQNLPKPNQKEGSINLWQLLTAVATLILIAFITFFYFSAPLAPAESVLNKDIPPGGNKAILTLANGKTINLNVAKSGIRITAATITYDDGTLITNDNTDNVPGLATITTPNGGEYQIVLSDGTKVWLNAASTLLYPTTFRERSVRKVELRSGEAYFQVAKESKRPFVVTTGQQDVLVLGTHFNINAYENEVAVKTTLEEGAVSVNRRKKDGTLRKSNLKPGEQAISSEAATLIRRVDVDLELAWKNGKIEFMDADIKSIMAMLERWYNIEVVYQGKPTEIPFTGSVSRNKTISQILKLLESTGDVKFKIKGRRVEVLNN